MKKNDFVTFEINKDGSTTFFLKENPRPDEEVYTNYTSLSIKHPTPMCDILNMVKQSDLTIYELGYLEELIRGLNDLRRE